MNDLCSGCGKPPHPGGCKLGPETDGAKARRAAEPTLVPMCNRGPDPAYIPGTDKLSSVHEQVVCALCRDRGLDYCDVRNHPPGSIFLDPPDPDKDFLYVGGLHPAMADLLRECVKIQATKGSDYTEGSNDRLNNFREAAEETDEPMEKVWYVYFFKHWKAVRSWVRFGKVESEPIRGRIVDCINYLLLLWLIVREKDPNQD